MNDIVKVEPPSEDDGIYVSVELPESSQEIDAFEWGGIKPKRPDDGGEIVVDGMANVTYISVVDDDNGVSIEEVYIGHDQLQAMDWIKVGEDDDKTE